MIDWIGYLRQISEPTAREFEFCMDDYLPLLRDSGYARFKIVNQLDIKGPLAPVPAREGKTINYQFMRCSSGVFGEDTSGAWLSMEEAAEEFNLILDNLQIHNYEIQPWYDIHVAR
jgi:hypothetical protein